MLRAPFLTFVGFGVTASRSTNWSPSGVRINRAGGVRNDVVVVGHGTKGEAR